MIRALEQAVARLARVPRLLVASDFDGVLSPIAERPAAARLDPRARAALLRLVELPGTPLAIISGRALGDLRDRTGALAGVRMIGSHGAEDEAGSEPALSTAALGELRGARVMLDHVASGAPGAWVEVKPFSVAVHYRTCAGPDALRVRQGCALAGRAFPGLRRLDGLMVVEFLASPHTKGSALAVLRHTERPDAVLFIGDDRTDEEGFAVLGPSDLGVRVGEGPTAAHLCVPTRAGAIDLVEALANRRRRVVRSPGLS